MRTKEEAQDYRYFPDSDLVPVVIDEPAVAEIKNSLPELPMEKYRRFTEEYKLSADDADILTGDRYLSEFFEDTVRKAPHRKRLPTGCWVICSGC